MYALICMYISRPELAAQVRDMYTIQFVTYIYVYINRSRLAAQDLKFFELSATDEYGTM